MSFAFPTKERKPGKEWKSKEKNEEEEPSPLSCDGGDYCVVVFVATGTIDAVLH